jgi:hypothetical protein
VIEKRIPIVKLKYKEAYEKLIQIIQAKTLYEALLNGSETRNEEDTKILLDYLGLKNFKKPALHTIILFDDATNCFHNKKDPLNGLFLRNRHHKFTYFLNVLLLRKGIIPQEILDNMKTFWLFGGYSEHNFTTAFKYIKSPLKRMELYNIYRKVGNRDVMYFNYTGGNGRTKIKVLRLDKKEDEEDDVDGSDGISDDDDPEVLFEF